MTSQALSPSGRLRLPVRSHVERVEPDDPLPFYYVPVVGSFYRRRLEMLLELLEGRRFGRLLEVATGSGVFLPTLAGYCDELWAMDLHSNLGMVRNMARLESVETRLLTASVFSLPFRSGSFDCVVTASMLEHLTDPGAAVDEMMRVLAPGGTLLAGFPVRNLPMDTFFKLVGYQVEHIHPSSHRDILQALQKRCAPGRVLTFPSWVPMDLSLYVGVVTAK